MTRQQAMGRVSKAVKEGRLPRVSTQTCVDCGKQAQAYDHRRYSAPLDVVPVCTPCNFKRGPAEDAGPPTMINVSLKPEQRVAIERMARHEDRSIASCLRNLAWLMARLPRRERHKRWRDLVDAVNLHEARRTDATGGATEAAA